MKAIVLIFLFLSVETSCKNNTVEPLKSEPPAQPVQPVSMRQLTQQEKESYTQKAAALYSNFLNNKAFNGSILVAKNGQVLLERYNGMANFATKEAIDQNTTFHLASVSKTFTAMAILKMWEQKRLSLDDDIRKYFPSFPYYGITIRLLLSHRSGLPNYAYVMPKSSNGYLYSNDDVINYFINYRPALARAVNTGFQYCNTNYVILAEIIEKLSGEAYPAYMRENIFQPLGMNNTFVCDKTNITTVPASYTVGNRPYTLESFDAIYGDKNIYSNVRDLLTWDKILYSGNFIKPQTAAMAYQPTSNEKQTVHNYGLGWRLINKDDVNVVYHTGWWHGNCNIFTRIVQDTTTVIILSNRYNSGVFRSKNTAMAFAKDILGKPTGTGNDMALGEAEGEDEGGGNK
jgi:CubicO group peptidase (beta-lactamase class C family)